MNIWILLLLVFCVVFILLGMFYPNEPKKKIKTKADGGPGEEQGGGPK
jgi:uncharacterized protein YneF (UPF0154 family)